MAAVASAPHSSSSLAGPAINRPTSAASERKRSASATPKPPAKKDDSPTPVAAPVIAPEQNDVPESDDKVDVDNSSSPQPTSPRAASPSADTLPNRPHIRPIPARSKFDLEPNPFEQSFRESHHSDSLDDVNEDSRPTPPRGGDATAIKHNALPPLSSLTSPAAADPSQFPWLANQGLRTGPLSPAMLTGPQGRSSISKGDGADNHNAFDQSTFRTGFTPGTGSGFTPGFNSLMANAGFSNMPLPSPNTAAFLNMVTNATPDTESADPHNPPQGDNHSHPQSISALPPHMQHQQHHGLSHISHGDMGQQDTITPGTLSALTGAVNDMNRQMSNGNGNQPPPHFYPPQNQQQRPPHINGNSNGSNGPPGPPGPGYPHVDYAQQSANAASQAANGLFLLSQAHQELSKREEEVGVPRPPGAPQMNIPGMGVGMQGMGGNGGMAPGAAHGMMYPGHHPGYMPQQQGLGGLPIPSSSLVQHYQQQQQQMQQQQAGLGQMSGQGQGQNGPQSTLMGKRNSNTGAGPSAATLASAAAAIMGNGASAPSTTVAQPAAAPAAAAGGRKRKSDAADGGPAPKAKKGKKGAAAAGASPADKPEKGESTSPMGGGMGGGGGMSSYGMRGMGMGMMGMDDDDDDVESEHDGISKITGKPETEEEKRKNFLERNRQAALKCRQRKKQWLNELQSKVEQLQLENDRLNQTVAGLHDEIGRLSGVLIQHRDCGLGLPTGYGRAPMR